MNYVNLPDLRHITRGFNLRIEAAKAISQVELLAHSGADASELKAQLGTFFSQCNNAVMEIGLPPPPAPQSKGKKKMGE